MIVFINLGNHNKNMYITLEIRHESASSTHDETREEYDNKSLLRLACNILSNNNSCVN